MKLKDYIEALAEFAKEHPESLDMDVVYSRDDEGNGYQKVHYTPSLGNYDNEWCGEFTSIESITESPVDYEGLEINSVCIN
jgi:hypothetical protein